MEGAKAEERPAAPRAAVAVLDAALWSSLAGAAPLERFAAAWLALQCRMIDRAIRGVLVLRGAGGTLAPAARWPERDGGSPELSQAAELAMAERRGVASRSRSAGDERTTLFAFPLTAPGSPEGVVAVECGPLPDAALRDVMRQLQWGAGWVELHARRSREGAAEARQRASMAALEVTASALQAGRLRDAARAIATELAVRLVASRVSLGRLRRRRVRMLATSHAVTVSKRSNAAAAVAAAMEEALDHQATLAFPPPEDAPLTSLRAHRALAGADGNIILTVPLLRPGGDAADPFGALTIEWPHDETLRQDMVELVEAVAALAGPALDRMMQAERWAGAVAFDAARRAGARILGREHYGLKLAVLATIAAAAFFALFSTEYRVGAHAVVEGELRRTIASGLDGYVASEHVRAGQTVHAGDLLATLDSAELVLQRLRWVATRGQHRLELDKALAGGQRAEVAIDNAQVDEASAEIALLDEEIARTRITAPFDGLVTSGDLSQSVGTPVQRAQVLFELAPLDSYRVVVRVPDNDIAQIQAGQTGVAGAGRVAGRDVRPARHPRQPRQRAGRRQQRLPRRGRAGPHDGEAAPEHGGRGAAAGRPGEAGLDLDPPSGGAGPDRPLVVVALAWPSACTASCGSASPASVRGCRRTCGSAASISAGSAGSCWRTRCRTACTASPLRRSRPWR